MAHLCEHFAECRLQLETELTVAEELESAEEEVDAQKGRREMDAAVNSEVGLVTQHYEEAHRQGVPSLLLPPFIVTNGKVSLPREAIPAVYLHQLSWLRARWKQLLIPMCSVCTEHVLLNHRTPWDNTLPHIVLNDSSVTRVSSRGRFLLELSTPRRVDALGNMVAVCGIQVSRSSVVNGRVTITVAALAPFTVGWWFNHGNDEIFFSKFPQDYNLRIHR